MSDQPKDDASVDVPADEQAPDTDAEQATETVTPTAEDGEPEDKAERLPLEVRIEDVGPARKKLIITVPEERVQQKWSESFEHLENEAQVPGFRKGRAPRRLLEKRFGTAVKQEVRGQILSEAYQQAIEENELVVIGEPDLGDVEKIELPEEGPLTFEVEIEVVPDFELPDYEGIPVTRPALAVTDADVETELERLAMQFGQQRALTEGTVSEGDYVQLDLRILEGENAGDDAPLIEHLPQATAQVHGEAAEYRGHVAGIVVEDLGRQLADRAIGDELRISMTGPSMHENERIKGQPITLAMRVDKAHRVEPADLEGLAPLLGVNSREEMAERIREMLQQRREQEQTNEMSRQICDYLLEHVEMDLPEGFSSRQISRVLDRRRTELAMNGVPEQEIEQRIAEMRDETEEASRREMKQFFILARIAEQLELDVSEGEVNSQIAMMARQQNRRPERLRSELAQSGQIEQIFMRIRDQKVLDALLDKASITDAEPEAASADEGQASDEAADESGTEAGR